MERHLCDFSSNRWYCERELAAHPPCIVKEGCALLDTSHAIDLWWCDWKDVTSSPIRRRPSKCMVWDTEHWEYLSISYLMECWPSQSSKSNVDKFGECAGGGGTCSLPAHSQMMGWCQPYGRYASLGVPWGARPSSNKQTNKPKIDKMLKRRDQSCFLVSLLLWHSLV